MGLYENNYDSDRFIDMEAFNISLIINFPKDEGKRFSVKSEIVGEYEGEKLVLASLYLTMFMESDESITLYLYSWEKEVYFNLGENFSPSMYLMSEVIKQAKQLKVSRITLFPQAYETNLMERKSLMTETKLIEIYESFGFKWKEKKSTLPGMSRLQDGKMVKDLVLTRCWMELNVA